MFLLGLLLLFVGSQFGFSQTVDPLLKEAPTSNRHQTVITTLAFSPNGRWFASGDKHGAILFWRLPEWRPTHRVDLEHAVDQLIFDLENKRLLAVTGPKVYSIAVDDVTDLREISVPPYGYSQQVRVSMSPDGKTLAIGRGHLFLYEYPRLTLTRTHRYAEENKPIVEFENLAFRPDGKELAVMRGSVAVIDQINLDDGTVTKKCVVAGDPVTHSWVTRRAMGYSRDGRLLAVSNNHGVALHRLDIGATEKLWGHRDLIHALAFAADGPTLISAGADQQIIGRSLPSGRINFVRHAPAAVRTLAVSPDGATLASAGVDQAISLWSLTDPKHTEPLMLLGTPIRTVNHRPAQPIPNTFRKDWQWYFLPFIMLVLLLFASGFKGTVKSLSSVPNSLFLGFFLLLKIALFFVISNHMTNLTPVGALTTRKLIVQLVLYGFVIITCTGLCLELGWRPSFFMKADDPQPTPPWWQRLLRAVGEGVTVFLTFLLYSFLLFHIFPPVDFDIKVTNPSSILLVMPSIDEEFIFRLGLFTAFAFCLKKVRWGTQVAAVLSSLIFAFSHLNNLDPLWVKWLQVLPLGLGLCWLYRRHGIEVSILVHLAFNMVSWQIIKFPE